MPRSPARPSLKRLPLAVVPGLDTDDTARDGRRIPTLNDDLLLVRLGAAASEPAPLDPTERADALVRKAARALDKPGIRRESVFGSGSGRGISAYSVYPSDPTKVVRESADGSRTVGRLVGGRFRATKG